MSMTSAVTLFSDVAMVLCYDCGWFVMSFQVDSGCDMSH